MGGKHLQLSSTLQPKRGGSVPSGIGAAKARQNQGQEHHCSTSRPPREEGVAQHGAHADCASIRNFPKGYKSMAATSWSPPSIPRAAIWAPGLS